MSFCVKNTNSKSETNAKPISPTFRGRRRCRSSACRAIRQSSVANCYFFNLAFLVAPSCRAIARRATAEAFALRLQILAFSLQTLALPHPRSQASILSILSKMSPSSRSLRSVKRIFASSRLCVRSFFILPFSFAFVFVTLGTECRLNSYFWARARRRGCR